MKNPLLTHQLTGLWILGVSGGPDSMALLSMAHEAHLTIHVVHVNYQKRETAQRDEAIVVHYCQRHSIPYTLEYAKYEQGNFQAWARNIRYQVMVNKALELSATGCMVAHHLLDDLETFELQKSRKSLVEWYGLKVESDYAGVKILRPLLDVSKEELVAYCSQRKVEFGIDESNESLTYTRNRIRKELIKLDMDQQRSLLEEKNTLNEDRHELLFRYRPELNRREIHEEIYKEIIQAWPLFLFEWIRHQTSLYPLALSYVQELSRQLIQSQSLKISLNEQWILLKQYGVISLITTPQAYCVVLNQVDSLKTDNFELNSSMGERIELSLDDFPIHIQNASGQEEFPIINGTKKLSRWFIDHKIPWDKRQTWPVVYNAKNELIYIYKCGFKKSVKSNNITLFMLK